MTRLTAVILTTLLLAPSHLYVSAQTAAPSSASKPKKKAMATELTASASQNGSHVTITSDGSVEMTMQDGSKRLTRPGVCGHTIVAPDGTKSTVSCAQVQPVSPPLPDQVSAGWLERHNSNLLVIIRSLLGNDQMSVDNYLRNDEPPTATVYDKIRLRTELIGTLTRPL